MLFLIKKHTNTLIEQTTTKQQETLEFKMNKQIQTFSFSPPITLDEESKWLLEVTSFEALNSVFNTINENNWFSITIPGHWDSKSAEKTIDELNKLLELRSQKRIELHVKEVKKRGNQIKKEIMKIKYQTLILKKNEILEELKNVKYNNIEDLV